jgi:hypothetical protein
MRRLWVDSMSEYEGERYHLPSCRQYPKPLQQPHPPVHFGGESDAALRRVADLGQGWYGFNLTPEATAERVSALDALLAACGRQRGEIQVSVCPYLRGMPSGGVERYREAGVDQLIVLLLAFDRDGLLRALDELAKTTLEPASRL